MFVDYIVRHDLDPAQALEVATKLEAIGITTVKDFVGYFSGHHEGPTVYKCWNSIAEWKTKGSILAKNFVTCCSHSKTTKLRQENVRT